MGIKVKYDPVGSMGLAAYATGVGQAQERRRKEALRLLEEQQRQKLAIGMRLQEQGFQAGENEKNRAAARARDFIPMDPAAPVAPPALPAPAAPAYPPAAPTYPGMPAPVGTGTVLRPPEAPPVGTGTVLRNPEAPAPTAPPIDAPFDPSTLPGAYTDDNGQVQVPRDVWQQHQAQVKAQELRDWAEDKTRVQDLKGLANMDAPDGVKSNSASFRQWQDTQSALREMLNGRTGDLDDPIHLEKIQQFRDELETLRRDNPDINSADKRAKNTFFKGPDGKEVPAGTPGATEWYDDPSDTKPPVQVVAPKTPEEKEAEKRAIEDRRTEMQFDLQDLKDAKKAVDADIDGPFDTDAKKAAEKKRLNDEYRNKWYPKPAAPAPSAPAAGSPPPVAPPVGTPQPAPGTPPPAAVPTDTPPSPPTSTPTAAGQPLPADRSQLAGAVWPDLNDPSKMFVPDLATNTWVEEKDPAKKKQHVLALCEQNLRSIMKAAVTPELPNPTYADLSPEGQAQVRKMIETRNNANSW